MKDGSREEMKLLLRKAREGKRQERKMERQASHAAVY